MAGRSYRRTRGTVCGPGFLRKRTIRGVPFIIGPSGYALGNLGTTFETANPFATPAAEIRIVPIDHLYLKSMVMAGDPSPLTSNPTGLVPTFRGNPVLVSEIGFTSGRNATSGTVDNVE